MISRLIASVVLLWALGFVVFSIALPTPLADIQTDAVVVPTGSGGRIARGLEVLRNQQAKRMLVTGVDPEVRPGEFAAEFGVERRLMKCCVTLGAKAADTRGNAVETVEWARSVDAQSIRLVTSDWHMRRASLELSRTMPGDIAIYEDAVPTRPSFHTLFLEYNKLLAAAAAPIAKQ